MRGVAVTQNVQSGIWTAYNDLDKFIRPTLLYFDRIYVDFLPGEVGHALAQIEVIEALGAYETRLPKRRSLNFGGFEEDSIELAVAEFVRGSGGRREEWALFEYFAGETTPSQLLNRLYPAAPKPGASLLIRLQLLHALPTPPDNASYESIIQFRAKRRDELEQLHQEIEAVAVQYSGTEDLEEGINAAQSRIQLALTTIDRISRETWTNRALGHLKASFAVGATAATATPSYWAQSTLTAFVGETLTPIIRGNCQTVNGHRTIPGRARPFAYAYDATAIF